MNSSKWMLCAMLFNFARDLAKACYCLHVRRYYLQYYDTIIYMVPLATKHYNVHATMVGRAEMRR